MTYPSCLNDLAALAVADASVAINLNATKCAATILDALPNRLVVVEEVAIELEAGRHKGRSDSDDLNTLVAAGKIAIVRLGNEGLRQFTELVSGPAGDTLDDGEAATIAYALEHKATALIDERKATKICSERFDSLPTGSTIDVLAQTVITATLGRAGLTKAVFNALHYGRMRVPSQHVDWVVNLIGRERAKKCVSLPKSIRKC